MKDLNTLVELFDKKSVALASIQESLDATTAMRRLMMNLFTSVSPREREVIGERIRDAMRPLKAQSKVESRPVFGQQPEDLNTLARMQRL